MITVLTEQPESPADRDHRVRVSLGVTGQIPPAVSDRFVERFGIGFVNVYSLTETGGVLIVNNRMDSPKPRANGLTHGWAEVTILDEDDQPMPPGVTGQIALRPRYPHIFMSGYFNAPERTLECLSNLWLHTGDLGHLDADGYLHFTGRQAIGCAAAARTSRPMRWKACSASVRACARSWWSERRPKRERRR